MLDGVQKLVIVGTGLLGASLGLALRARGFSGRMVGVARRESVGSEAVKRGCVDEAVLEAGPACADADLVVVATPLGAFEAVFGAITGTDAVVTDVGSTKGSVVRQAEALLGRPERFVGAHPMAGSEKQGPEAAFAELLEGKPCVLTPREGACAEAVALVESLWRCVGMKLVRMDADEHDHKMAVVSHLPHLAAVGLIEQVIEVGGWEVGSTGLRDTTRLASSNPPMRADIVHENRVALAEQLRGYGQRMLRLAELVAGDDYDALLSELESVKARRDAWLEQRERES
ncbi:prephenate dehydrogenase [Mucisphaera calidilacus]|uniref:T-protein n=1 Tax=Mucisphaera calidilacus TaxID=2527982 RepID=A0A518BXE2_9BACT|nr:prephenate dehydrogenase [Mucisphaera calidilacus]QDU71647.1 T-protein [Mucisphaera calidilacus]